eukprot:gene1678-1832_t
MSSFIVQSKLFIVQTNDPDLGSYRWKCDKFSSSPDDFFWENFLLELKKAQLWPEDRVFHLLEAFDNQKGQYVTLSPENVMSFWSTAQPVHLLVHLLHNSDNTHNGQGTMMMMMIAGRSFNTDESGLAIGHQGGRILIQEVSAAALGTGLVSWDGAVVLAKYLESHEEIIRGKHVLEVGAGTGIAGMAAALLGASSVILTDLPYALSNLQSNIARTIDNNSHLIDHNHLNSKMLDWKDPNTYPIDHHWEVILGADVVWLEDLVHPLVEALRSCSSEDTRILLAHQTRTLRTDSVLWDALTTAGFSWKTIPSNELHVDFSSPRISIIKIKKTQR